jgi:hypothetical protein
MATVCVFSTSVVHASTSTGADKKPDEKLKTYEVTAKYEVCTRFI